MYLKICGVTGRLAVKEASFSLPSNTRTEEFQELLSHYGKRTADCRMFTWTLGILWMCQQVACTVNSPFLLYPGFLASWLSLSQHRSFMECVSFLVFHSIYTEDLLQDAQPSMSIAENREASKEREVPLLRLGSVTSPHPTSSKFRFFIFPLFLQSVPFWNNHVWGSETAFLFSPLVSALGEMRSPEKWDTQVFIPSCLWI